MFHFLIPLADVGNAITNIAKMLVGWLGAVLGFVLVIAGYTYMFALDDHTKAAQAKRAIGVAVVGAIIVAVGIALALKLVTQIGS